MHLFRRLINILEAQSLSEGVIKVPPALLDRITKELVMRVLWSLSAVNNPAFPAIIKQESSYFGVSIPTSRHPKTDSIELPLDLTGLPANYVSHWGNRSTLKVIFKFRSTDRDALAGVDSEVKPMTGAKEFFDIRIMRKKASFGMSMVFRLDKIIDSMLEYMNQSNALGTVFSFHHALERLSFIVTHELQHVVQKSVFGSEFKKPLSRLAYFLSADEFDPQITSGINDLLHTISVVRSQGVDVDVRQTIKNYLSRDEFFLALFNNDKERYKTAVRKLYVGVRDGLK